MLNSALEQSLPTKKDDLLFTQRSLQTLIAMAAEYRPQQKQRTPQQRQDTATYLKITLILGEYLEILRNDAITIVCEPGYTETNHLLLAKTIEAELRRKQDLLNNPHILPQEVEQLRQVLIPNFMINEMLEFNALHNEIVLAITARIGNAKNPPSFTSQFNKLRESTTSLKESTASNTTDVNPQKDTKLR